MLRGYVHAVWAFWRTPLPGSQKRKAIYWLARRYDWVAELDRRFAAHGMEQVLDCYGELYYLFRRMYAFLHKDTVQAIEASGGNCLLDWIEPHFATLVTHYGVEGVCAMHADGLSLWEGEHPEGHRLGLALRFVHRNRREGLMTLVLRMDGEDLYYINFALRDETVWIGSVQGAKGQVAAMRRFTQLSNGVPPQRAVYFALTVLAQQWGMTQVRGVKHAAQVFQREEKTRYKLENFNYDDFWAQLSPVGDDAHWWHMPLPYARKPLSEVNAKKRGKLKKRYAFLDWIEEGIRNGSAA